MTLLAAGIEIRILSQLTKYEKNYVRVESKLKERSVSNPLLFELALLLLMLLLLLLVLLLLIVELSKVHIWLLSK